MPTIQFREVLRVLLKHEVDFVVVGAVALISPTPTVAKFDKGRADLAVQRVGDDDAARADHYPKTLATTFKCS